MTEMMSQEDFVNSTSEIQPGEELILSVDRNKFMEELYPVACMIDRFFPLVLYPIGFVGNVISACVWFHPRFRNRNSSSLYLALLSLSDLAYLVLHSIDHMSKLLGWGVATRPAFCEVFYFLINIPQYLCPLLVFGFTVDRFVAILYPLYRRILCRKKNAITAITVMVTVSVLLASIQPLFWTYSPDTKYCNLRKTIPNLETILTVWSWLTEILFSFAVPLTVIVLNTFVMCSLCRLKRNPQRVVDERAVPLKDFGKESGKPAAKTDEEHTQTQGAGEGGKATSVKKRNEGCSLRGAKVLYQVATSMLVTVSMYEMVSLLTLAILYLLHQSFPRGAVPLTRDQILADETWQSYFAYNAAKYVLVSLFMTRYASLVFIFLVMGGEFRNVLCSIITRKKSPRKVERTKSSGVRSSIMSTSQIKPVEDSLLEGQCPQTKEGQRF